MLNTNKNIILVLLLIIPLLLLLLCYSKNSSDNNEKFTGSTIENFSITNYDDKNLLDIVKNLMGLNKSKEKPKNTNLNKNPITTTIKQKKSNNIIDVSNNVSNNVSDNVSNNVYENVSDNVSDKDINSNKKIEKLTVNDTLKIFKPKDIPLLNNVGKQQKIGSNLVKTNFQEETDKCKFFGSSCPNGYTRFGTFSIINDSILNGEKLICDKSISDNNETCAYCCKE